MKLSFLIFAVPVVAVAFGDSSDELGEVPRAAAEGPLVLANLEQSSYCYGAQNFNCYT
jgi:hypothetical protein